MRSNRILYFHILLIEQHQRHRVFIFQFFVRNGLLFALLVDYFEHYVFHIVFHSVYADYLDIGVA